MTIFPGDEGAQLVSGKIAMYGTSDGGTTWYPVTVDTDGRLSIVSGLVPEEYDYIALSYTGDNLTGVVYRANGSSGTVVATLVLAYDGSDNLITVTRT